MPEKNWLTSLPLLSPQQHREIRAIFRRGLVETPLPTVLTDLQGRILGCNPQFAQLCAADDADLVGRSVTDLAHELDRARVQLNLTRLAAGERRELTYEARWVRSDGRVIWTRRHVMRVEGPAGPDDVVLVAIQEDLTAHRLAERRAEALAELAKRIATGASISETAGRLAELAAAEWSGVGCSLSILDESGRYLIPVRHGQVPEAFYDALGPVPVGQLGAACGIAAWRDEPTAIPDMLSDPRTEHLRPLLAQYGVVSAWSVPLHDPAGAVIGSLGLFHPRQQAPTESDWQTLNGLAGVAALAVILERQRQQTRAAAQRLRTDARTGLPNDLAMVEKLQRLIAERTPFTLAIATLRTGGTAIAATGAQDQLLGALGRRAQGIAGVESVAIVRPVSVALVARIEWSDREAHLLRRVLSQPLEVDELTLHPRLALGAVTWDGIRDVRAEDLLAMAGSVAPDRGARSASVAEPAPDASVDLAGDVLRAIRAGEFVVHYQPQFDLATASVVGSEALVRWQHPELGLLSPGSFLDAVEEADVGPELAFAVLRQVQADTRQRAAIGLTGRVAVNLSATDLLNEVLVDVLRDPDERLWEAVSLELTESALVEPGTVSALEDLAAAGFTIVLDDFGTGYSALSLIHDLPLSVVKIDQTFISRLTSDSCAEAMVAAITSMCAQLRMTVVAEGIETSQQAVSARALGCHVGQGYLFARPQPLEQLSAASLRQRPQPPRPVTMPSMTQLVHERIIELAHRGASPHTIAAALNRDGMRTARGTRWHARSVSQVLARDTRG
ncbi:MAG TPA: EAL domain-containing protein [Mycobacteriales bacterium]|nr:EAL domain-containing protein [Mycobacteriales bacterium]